MTRSTTLSALALAVLLSGTATAQNPPAPPKPAAKPTTSAMATHKPKPHHVREAQPGLLKQAKISADVAEQTALANNPGGTVTHREIEKSKGVLVYAFDIKVPGQEGYQEVMVDATTGAVVSTTHETAKAEAKEKAKGKGKKPPKKPAQ